jgi:hypothetical protein
MMRQSQPQASKVPACRAFPAHACLGLCHDRSRGLPCARAPDVLEQPRREGALRPRRTPMWVGFLLCCMIAIACAAWIASATAGPLHIIDVFVAIFLFRALDRAGVFASDLWRTRRAR